LDHSEVARQVGFGYDTIFLLPGRAIRSARCRRRKRRYSPGESFAGAAHVRGIWSSFRPDGLGRPCNTRARMAPIGRTCAVFVLAFLVAACSSPAPPTGRTSASASSPAAGVFVSARYRYTIKLQDGWVGTPAVVTWVGTTWLAVDNPAA